MTYLSAMFCGTNLRTRTFVNAQGNLNFPKFVLPTAGQPRFYNFTGSGYSIFSLERSNPITNYDKLCLISFCQVHTALIIIFIFQYVLIHQSDARTGGWYKYIALSTYCRVRVRVRVKGGLGGGFKHCF